MPAMGVYTPPVYSVSPSGQGGPRLSFTSDNIYGFDAFTSAVLDRIRKDAETNGLTAWGYSVLKNLGQPIKPEWLKENSREWFDKPLPDFRVPPREDFLKLVEPVVIDPSSRGVTSQLKTLAIRDPNGFGGLFQQYHADEGEKAFEGLPDYLNPSVMRARSDAMAAEQRDHPMDARFYNLNLNDLQKTADRARAAGVNGSLEGIGGLGWSRSSGADWLKQFAENEWTAAGQGNYAGVGSPPPPTPGAFQQPAQMIQPPAVTQSTGGRTPPPPATSALPPMNTNTTSPMAVPQYNAQQQARVDQLNANAQQVFGTVVPSTVTYGQPSRATRMRTRAYA